MFGSYFESATCFVHLVPAADIGLVAHFLRTDVGIVLLVDSLVPHAELGAVIAVGVVFNRAAAVIADVRELFGHRELNAESEHVGNFCTLVGRHGFGDSDGAVCIDGICHGQSGRNSGD